MGKTSYPIYRNGDIIAYADSLSYIGYRMGDEYVSVTIKSAAPLSLRCGDYMVYRNEKWSVSSRTQVRKSARSGTHRDAFVYDGIKLWPASYELRRLEMQDVVIGDNKLVTMMPTFSFYAQNVLALAERIKANLDREYSGDSRWKVRVLVKGKDGNNNYVTKYYVCGYNAQLDTLGTDEVSAIPDGFTVVGEEDKNISISSEKLWNVLTSKVNGEFGVNWIIKGRVITIGAEGLSYGSYFQNEALMYGMNNGCVSIEAVPEEASDNLCTRLRAYGNSTNMPARYYQRKHIVYYADGVYESYTENRQTTYKVINVRGLYPRCLKGLTEVIDQKTEKLDYYTLSVKIKRGDGAQETRDARLYETGLLRIYLNNDDSLWIAKDSVIVYFDKSQVKHEGWPVKWMSVDSESVIPDNVNVDKLMLPGFPDYPVSEYKTVVKKTKGVKIASQTTTSHILENTYDATGTLKPYFGGGVESSICGDEDAHEMTPVFWVETEGSERPTFDIVATKVDTSKIEVSMSSISESTKTLIENDINNVPSDKEWSLPGFHGFKFVEDGVTEYIFSKFEASLNEDTGYVCYITLNVPYSKDYFSNEVYGVVEGKTIKLKYDNDEKKFKLISNDDIGDLTGKDIVLVSGIDTDSFPTAYIETTETTHTVSNGSEVITDPYLVSENIETLGLFEKNVTFDGSVEDYDDIYPTIKKVTVGQVRAAGYFVPTVFEDDERIDKLGGEKIATHITDNGIFNLTDKEQKIDNSEFSIWIKQSGFDLEAASKNTTESMSIAFKTGKLAGREFSVKKVIPDGDYWNLRVDRISDDAIGRYFPYKDYNFADGDEFVLLGFPLPDMYVDAASVRLLEAAQRYLKEHDYVITTYQIEVDEIYMQRQHEWAQNPDNNQLSLHDNLVAGDMIILNDDDIMWDVTGTKKERKIFVDKVEIKEGEGLLPSYSISLRQNKKLTKWEKIQSDVSDSVTSVIESNISNSPVMKAAARSYASSSSASGNYLSLEGGEVDGDVKVDGNLSVSGDSTFVNAKVSGVLHVTKLTADTIEEMEAKHISGKVISSAAGCIVSDVEFDGDDYICYFPSKNENGVSVNNNWFVGDFAYCEQFKLDDDGEYITNKCYWRKVIAVGTSNGLHYVKLSCDDCSESLNDVPSEGDSIVLLGSTNQDRQGAIVQSPIGEFWYDGELYQGPYECQYVGINSFELPDPVNVKSPGLTVVNADVIRLTSGKNVGEMLDGGFEISRVSWSATTSDVTVEGVVMVRPQETYDWDDVEPSSAWTTQAEREKHLGDFLITNNGYTYRFVVGDTDDEYVWSWVEDALLDEINSKQQQMARQMSGFISEGDYARLWSEVWDENGETLLSEADVVTGTNFDSIANTWFSYVDITADRITIDAAHQLSLTAGTFTINTTNFTLDENGDVSITGNVSASSGKIAFFDIDSESLSQTKTIADGSKREMSLDESGLEIKRTSSEGVLRQRLRLGVVDSDGNREEMIHAEQSNTDEPVAYIHNTSAINSVSVDTRGVHRGFGVPCYGSISNLRLCKGSTYFLLVNAQTTTEATLPSISNMQSVGVIIRIVNICGSAITIKKNDATIYKSSSETVEEKSLPNNTTFDFLFDGYEWYYYQIE